MLECSESEDGRVKAAAQVACKSFVVNGARVIKGNMDTRFSGISSPPDLAQSPDQIDLWFLFTDQVATASELTLRYRDILEEKRKAKSCASISPGSPSLFADPNFGLHRSVALHTHFGDRLAFRAERLWSANCCQ